MGLLQSAGAGQGVVVMNGSAICRSCDISQVERLDVRVGNGLDLANRRDVGWVTEQVGKPLLKTKVSLDRLTMADLSDRRHVPAASLEDWVPIRCYPPANCRWNSLLLISGRAG